MWNGKNIAIAAEIDTMNLEQARMSWQLEVALKDRLAEMTERPRELFGVLVSALNSSLPVILTRRENLGGTVVESDTTVIVTRMSITGARTSDRIRVHYWGFSHDVYLADIIDAKTPDIEYRDI